MERFTVSFTTTPTYARAHYFDTVRGRDNVGHHRLYLMTPISLPDGTVYGFATAAITACHSQTLWGKPQIMDCHDISEAHLPALLSYLGQCFEINRDDITVTNEAREAQPALRLVP